MASVLVGTLAGLLGVGFVVLVMVAMCGACEGHGER